MEFTWKHISVLESWRWIEFWYSKKHSWPSKSVWCLTFNHYKDSLWCHLSLGGWHTNIVFNNIIVNVAFQKFYFVLHWPWRKLYSSIEVVDQMKGLPLRLLSSWENFVIFAHFSEFLTYYIVIYSSIWVTANNRDSKIKSHLGINLRMKKGTHFDLLGVADCYAESKSSYRV